MRDEIVRVVRRDGDSGESEKCRLDAGADGARAPDDVVARVRPVVHPGDDGVELRILSPECVGDTIRGDALERVPPGVVVAHAATVPGAADAALVLVRGDDGHVADGG